jgi:hypothetical protein
MKTKLSFETLENKLTLSSVNVSIHNCLWKGHNNYNFQRPSRSHIIVNSPKHPIAPIVVPFK